MKGLFTRNFTSQMATFFISYYLIPSSVWNSTFPRTPNYPPTLKLQFKTQPAEGAAHLCNPSRSSAAGPGLLGRYTGSCQEC